MRVSKLALVVFVVLAAAGVAVADTKQHNVPTSPSGDLVVALCDGTTSTAVKGKKPGDQLTPAEAKKVSDDLMAQWRKKNPTLGATWEREAASAQKNAPPAVGNIPTTNDRVQDGHTYGAFTTRDEQIWQASTQAFIDKGNQIFHDAKAVGGTISVSCDMCHPNAANTHPETYPKFQVQLGRVALLRDMINWCIENPARGKPLAEDDPKLKAMEAYIYAQRRGMALDYGKH